jgi:hypothetical protein
VTLPPCSWALLVLLLLSLLSSGANPAACWGQSWGRGLEMSQLLASSEMYPQSPSCSLALLIIPLASLLKGAALQTRTSTDTENDRHAAEHDLTPVSQAGSVFHSQLHLARLPCGMTAPPKAKEAKFKITYSPASSRCRKALSCPFRTQETEAQRRCMLGPRSCHQDWTWTPGQGPLLRV